MPSEHDLSHFTLNLPDEDSEDLTDAEVDGAIPLLALQSLTPYLKACPICESAVLKFHYARRKRKPNVYWRVHLTCTQGHERQLVFRIGFL